MKDMITEAEPDCPFEFNFDATSFKVGDIVSYRVPGALGEMPFVGELLEVHEDHVVLHHYGEPDAQIRRMRGTREDRPCVSDADALAD